VPAALAISAFAPWLVTPLLMLGGAYLCFEGCEKLAHRYLHSAADDAARKAALARALQDTTVDLVAFERDKIKGATRTDFILSAEIIAITLGTVAGSAFTTQLLVLSGVAVLMTVGVYGVVAGIVKLDDLGLWLTHRRRATVQGLGRGILAFAPWLMKALTVAGTAAMFLVGGGILVHGVPAVAHAIEHAVAPLGAVAAAVLPTLASAVIGVLAGSLVLAGVTAVQKLRRR
jgi:predicted DNA repair protein MutK